MKSNSFSAVAVLVAIMVVASGCIEESYSRNALSSGGGGGGTTIINNTYYGTMNQTPNMTAGPAGAPGAPGTAATINVNYTFTGSPGAAALVSNIGTVNAAIFDFTIPQGVNGTPGDPGPIGPTGPMNQTINLTANMTAGPPGGIGGQVLFFNNTEGGLVAGYEGLYPIPSGATEIDESDTVNSGLGQVLIDPYITPPGYPGVTVIPSGLWRFRTFHYVSSASGTTTVVFKVYNRTVGGTETLQITATSEDIDALTATEYLTSYVKTSDISMPSSDTIAIKVYGQTTHPANIDLHFVYQGTTHTSHVQTPLELLSSQYRTAAQDDEQDAGILFQADQHILSNLSTVNQWISLNKTQILSVTLINTTSAQAAALRSADDHISTNSSAGGLSAATLLEADSHIASNKTAILSATLINVTSAQAAALRAADDHIATNSSGGGVSAPAALQAADAHILTNMTLGAGANWTVLYQSEFLDPSTQAIPGFLGAAISSGTVAAVASDVNHPGVIYMRDSTTAAGGYRYGCQGTQVLQGGEFFEVVFQPVGVRGTQASKFGWADTAAAATLPVDGVWFNVSGTGAAQTFMGATSSNSVRTYTPSYTTTTATWYRGTISIASGGAPVTYTLYSPSGAQLWQQTLSASIPNATGRDTSPCIIVSETSTDAAANILLLDYVRWGTTKVVRR